MCKSQIPYKDIKDLEICIRLKTESNEPIKVEVDCKDTAALTLAFVYNDVLREAVIKAIPYVIATSSDPIEKQIAISESVQWILNEINAQL